MAYKKGKGKPKMKITRRRLKLRRSLYRSKASMNVHHFKRTYEATNLNISATAPVSGTLTVQMASIPDVTDFTTLFDRYRINKVIVRFVPNFTGSDLNPSSSVISIPNFHTVLDYDDSTAPGSLNNMFQYSTYRMTRGNKIHIRKYTPSVLTAQGSGSTYGPKWKQWLDLSDLTINQYGLKFWIDQQNAGGVGTFKPYVTVYFSCAGPR